mmetsp:Transcript_1213/g.3749  ORF Transcript_1213/g.3749 Transcript_1213/m.3749 type:complete len:398 (-) Transcript_1213:404-1597(-)
MATEGYTSSYMVDPVNRHGLPSRLVAGQPGEHGRSAIESTAGLSNVNMYPDRRVEHHGSASYPSFTLGHASEAAHEMERSRYGGSTAFPTQNSAGAQHYGYEACYVPNYADDLVYKGIRGSEDIVLHQQSHPVIHRSAYYGLPSYLPSIQPSQASLISAERLPPTGYPGQGAQIAHLRQCVAEYQQINMRLHDELIMARHEIERLKKQIASIASHDKEKNDASKSTRRYWAPDEHKRFLEGVRKYGQRDVRAIANHVGTRNPTQVRTHAQKYFLKVQKENGAEACRSHANDEQGLSGQRRCMSEGDLFRVRQATTSEKTEERDEDSTKETTKTENDDRPHVKDSAESSRTLPSVQSAEKLMDIRDKDVKSAEPSDNGNVAQKPPVHPKSSKKGEADP